MIAINFCLLESVTKMIRGEKALDIAKRCSNVLYGGSVEGLRAEDILHIQGVPCSDISTIEQKSIADVVVFVGALASKGIQIVHYTYYLFDLRSSEANDTGWRFVFK